MNYLWPLLLFFGMALLLLGGESYLLRRWRRQIPLRIAVTGTRGKSSVCRLLRSELAIRNIAAMAKVTGTRPEIILPDGKALPLKRRGRANIIEQKRVLRKAARLGVEAVVMEIMSLEEENHFVEAQRLIMPTHLLITNARPDHTALHGTATEDICRTYAFCITPGCRVIHGIPACRELFQQICRQNQALAFPVPHDGAETQPPAEKRADHFRDNLRLVTTALTVLGQTPEIRSPQAPHADSLAVVTWERAEGKPVRILNAFSANDPLSSFESFHKASSPDTAPEAILKAPLLLNLRKLRPDRSASWARWLAGEKYKRRIMLIGHAAACRLFRHQYRRCRRASGDGGNLHTIRQRHPGAIMKELDALLSRDTDLLLAAGNYHGRGEALQHYWQRRSFINA